MCQICKFHFVESLPFKILNVLNMFFLSGHLCRVARSSGDLGNPFHKCHGLMPVDANHSNCRNSNDRRNLNKRKCQEDTEL